MSSPRFSSGHSLRAYRVSALTSFLVHAKIYPSPAEAPIENGAILVHEGRILAVGPTASIKIPRHATVIDCKGYIEQFDTSGEFAWMSRAGTNAQQILASLTTNPAMRFGYSSHSGRVAKGMVADLVVLDGDPGRDVTAFSKVHQVIRGRTSDLSNRLKPQ